jgi:hypothetical protein
VPDFIKCLGYIQKGCRAILFGFDCFVNLVHYSVCLLNCLMSLTKAKLVVRYD